MVKIEIGRVVNIPEGVVVGIAGGVVSVKKGDKEIKREFNLGKLKLEKTEKEIKITCKNGTKREGKLAGTIGAHIKNMMRGVAEGFVYKLEVCNVHFPMNVKAEGDKIIVKSFLGESVERCAKILPGVSVDIKGNEITISSSSREEAGQTAANIEGSTRLNNRDRRIFQDGIFITEKPGREL